MTPTEWQPGWKVLSARRSPCVSGRAGRHYPAKEIVQPAAACGPLAVFAAQEQAVCWMDDIYRGRARSRLPIEIVRCGYLPSPHARLWYPGHPRRQLPTDEVTAYPIAWCPPGTCLADAVCCWE